MVLPAGRLDRALIRRLAVLAALFGSSAAYAAEPTLVVLAGPRADDSDAERRTDSRLKAMGFSDLEYVRAESLEDRVELIVLDEREEDFTCGGSIPLQGWLDEIDAGEIDIQLLEFQSAVARLRALELDIGCLDRVPTRRDVQRLAVAQASAHLFMSQLTLNPAEATQERSLASRAAARVVAVGEDLVLPQGLDPELQSLIAEAKRGDPVRVAGAGLLGRVYIDGQLVGREPVLRRAGMHLLQVEGSGGPEPVVAAALLPLAPGRSLVWAGSTAIGQVESEAQALARGEPIGTSLLEAVAYALGQPVLIAGLSNQGVSVYRPDGTLLSRSSARDELPNRSDEPEPGQSQPVGADRIEVDEDIDFTWRGEWQGVVGAGLSLGGSTLSGEPFAAFGGPLGGVAVWARYGVTERMSLAAALSPQARAVALEPGYEDLWLWRAHVPVRVGLRGGTRHRSFNWELGGDVMVDWLGRYDGRLRVHPGVVAAAGLGVPLVGQLGLRLEGYAGFARNALVLGAQGGAEWGW